MTDGEPRRQADQFACNHAPVAELDPDNYDVGEEVACDDCGHSFVVEADDYRDRYFVAEHAIELREVARRRTELSVIDRDEETDAAGLTYREAFMLPYKRRLTWVAVGLSITMAILGEAVFGLLYLVVYSLAAGKLELIRHGGQA